MQTKASDMNWDSIQHFSPEEWPDSTLEHMNASVIWALSKLRNRLPADHSIMPSPVPAGHVHHNYSGSRHSTKKGERLSDATDVFMSWGHVWGAWMEAIQLPEIGGLGIYMDTRWGWKRMPMLHIDTRPNRVMWVRSEGIYTYYHSSPVMFHKALAGHGRVA